MLHILAVTRLCFAQGVIFQQPLQGEAYISDFNNAFVLCAGGVTYRDPLNGELKQQGEAAETFCRNLALCHDVYVESPTEGGPATSKDGEVQYMYSSPDEVRQSREEGVLAYRTRQRPRCQPSNPNP